MAFAAGEVKKEYYNQKDVELDKNRWWAIKDEKESADYVIAEVERIRRSQSDREQRIILLSQLYQNEDITSFRTGYYAAKDRLTGNNRITLNVIKSCTDTLVAKIGTKKPRPVFLTQKGNWNKQRRAKNLTRYIEGVYTTGHAWREGREALRDACITGLGALKVMKESGRVIFRRVPESEIVVDEHEAMYGKPPQLFHTYWVPRDELIEKYPKKKTEIKEASSLIARPGANPRAFQMVEVFEAWRPKSDISEGRWIKCIRGARLEESVYKRDYYPFGFCRYSKKLFGFYALSLSEDIIGIQLEINKILRTIAQAQHLMSVPQAWLEVANRAIVGKLNNKIGGVRFYKGAPPIFFTPQAMSPEVYAHLERLIERAYQITGISQLSAQGKKPSGIDAKVALRELQDIEAERFQATEQSFDEMFLDLVPIVTDLTDELHQENPELKVKAAGRKEMESIKWADVRMEIDDYTFQLFPSSLLPSTPGARLQKVQELMQTGIYDRETAVGLLDFPDVEAANSMVTATRDCIMRIIADIEDEKGYQPPEPEMDFEYARKMATVAYLSARNDAAPQPVLEDMLGLISDLDSLREMRDAAAQGMMMEQTTSRNSLQPDGMAGLAQAAQPPVSELLPIAQ